MEPLTANDRRHAQLLLRSNEQANASIRGALRATQNSRIEAVTRDVSHTHRRMADQLRFYLRAYDQFSHPRGAHIQSRPWPPAPPRHVLSRLEEHQYGLRSDYEKARTNTASKALQLIIEQHEQNLRTNVHRIRKLGSSFVGAPAVSIADETQTQTQT